MDRRGFTLLEVLLATAILGIILTTVYGTVARSLQAKQHAEGRAELYAAGRDAVLRIADEVEGALSPRPNSDVFFVGVAGNQRVPADELHFFTIIRRQFTASRSQGGRALVSYQLDPMPRTPGLFALRRQEELLSLPLGDGTGEYSDEEPGGNEFDTGVEAANAPAQSPILAAHLLDRVAGLRFRYFDPETHDWLDSWDTTADLQPGEAPMSLPAAVQVILFLADQDGGVHDFGTIVDLPLANLQPTPTR
jgi:prepilin-type N-terminal cleavage/methylation domain-containing protein